MAEDKHNEPQTGFGHLSDLLKALGQYGHSEFWYKQTEIGVPGTSGYRLLRRIFTRDGREIARWGMNGYQWDFLPAHSMPNKNANCPPPSDAALMDSLLATQTQFYADLGDVYQS